MTLHLDSPATGTAARAIPYELSGDLPLTLSPRSEGPRARDLGALCDWLRENRAWVGARLTEHGALRFRGFAVDGAEDFERLARAVDDDLANEYLGTSPRDALTDYVFNASELPDFYPIPQHCEMSFCARPPRRVFFCCLEEPAADSGETPLCDFRKVWRDLDPDLRDRFLEHGLRHVRNYVGPGGGRDARGAHRIGVPAATGVANGCDMVDTDAETKLATHALPSFPAAGRAFRRRPRTLSPRARRLTMRRRCNSRYLVTTLSTGQ